MTPETKINKTDMIRDIVTKNPEAKPADIVKQLAEKGVKITNTFVSVVKSRMKNPPKAKPKQARPIGAAKRRRIGAKKARPVARVKKSAKADLANYEDLMLVKGLTNKISIDNIIAAANALKKLS